MLKAALFAGASGLTLFAVLAAAPRKTVTATVERQHKKEISDVYSDIRGLRNNNPGNIRHGDNWQGMASDQTDRSFIRFESPEWGVRAMGRVLVNYQKKYQLNTVADIISRWAPPIENNTESYVNAVARALGVSPNQPIDVKTNLLPLTKAIIQHENGIQPYSDALLNQGLALV